MNLYLEYWFVFFFIFPILEWGLHYYLHVFNNYTHTKHHKIVTKHWLNKKNRIKIEKWPTIPIFICWYNTFYIGVLFFAKYYIVHSLIHFYPTLIPKLANHHNTHHKYSNYNFCVTNIWPDILFKTQYTKS